MATACAGVTVTWSGAALGEVTDIKANVGGSLPISRGSTVPTSVPWGIDVGSIDISCLSAAQIVAQYGRKSTLAITGGGLTFSTKAVFQTLQMTGKVNDVARYAATFKIVME